MCYVRIRFCFHQLFDFKFRVQFYVLSSRMKRFTYPVFPLGQIIIPADRKTKTVKQRRLFLRESVILPRNVTFCFRHRPFCPVPLFQYPTSSIHEEIGRRVRHEYIDGLCILPISGPLSPHRDRFVLILVRQVLDIPKVAFWCVIDDGVFFISR